MTPELIELMRAYQAKRREMQDAEDEAERIELRLRELAKTIERLDGEVMRASMELNAKAWAAIEGAAVNGDEHHG